MFTLLFEAPKASCREERAVTLVPARFSAKYNTIAKDAQIKLCIKHIEIWIVFKAEMELIAKR